MWLDQRGTGLSTAISADMLSSKSDEEKAAYLKHFRADSIGKETHSLCIDLISCNHILSCLYTVVKDCEIIRKILLGHKKNPEDQKWTIMGQSFGGFCAINYLSFYGEGLKEVFLTGGLAPLNDHPDPVYEALISKVLSRSNTVAAPLTCSEEKVIKRNQVYYEKYPQDIKRVRGSFTSS